MVVYAVVCVRVVFGSVLVAGWPPFVGWLLAWLAACSLFVLDVCGVGCFSFWCWGLEFGFDCFSS